MIRVACIAAALALVAVPAHAAEKGMVSYDALSPKARDLTGEGLTFSYSKTFLHMRVLAIRATAVPVGVIVTPLTDGQTAQKLDRLAGEDAKVGSLYLIHPDEEQGNVMVQAFCPGSKTGWLSIGPIRHAQPLRVYAFGDDPGTGEPKLCATMDFQFRGEWRMPKTNTADPTDMVFAPDY